MEEINLKEGLDNAFDNLIVMGIETDQKNELNYQNIINNTFKLKFLEIYPYLESLCFLPKYLDNFHIVFIILKIIQWCFPNGVKIYDENFNILNANDEENMQSLKFSQYSKMYAKFNKVRKLDTIY